MNNPAEQDERKGPDPGRTPGSAEGPRDRPADKGRDPGRTPGAAEGDRETVEKNLRRQGGG